MYRSSRKANKVQKYNDALFTNNATIVSCVQNMGAHRNSDTGNDIVTLVNL